MHTYTFTEYELRQLLDDTLTEARLVYLKRRSAVTKQRGPDGKSHDWFVASEDALRQALESVWFDSTRSAPQATGLPVEALP